MLTEADVIVGHNIINFDIPALRKTYSWFEPSGDVIDTLILSRLYHPNMMEIDKKRILKECHYNYMDDIA